MRTDTEAKEPTAEGVDSKGRAKVLPPWHVVIAAIVALPLAIFGTPENLLPKERLRWYYVHQGVEMRMALQAEFLLFRIVCAGIVLLAIF